jgi:hypothetical protein
MRFITITFLLSIGLIVSCNIANSHIQQNTALQSVNTQTKSNSESIDKEKLNRFLSEDVRRVLEKAEEFEIFALNPGVLFNPQKVVGETLRATKDTRYAVIGKTKIVDSTYKYRLKRDSDKSRFFFCRHYFIFGRSFPV